MPLWPPKNIRVISIDELLGEGHQTHGTRTIRLQPVLLTDVTPFSTNLAARYARERQRD